MNYLILFSVPLLVIMFQSTDCMFLRFKNRGAFQRQDNFQDNSIGGGGGGGLRILSVLLEYITENKPELLPVLTEIAVQNPRLLRLVMGGLAKRDTSSQVEYSNETIDPLLVRKMFEYVLDNDNDDCFKKFACGLTKNSTITTADDLIGYNLAEDNEAIDIRQECSTRFTRCSFKEYKTRDIITEMSDSQSSQINTSSD